MSSAPAASPSEVNAVISEEVNGAYYSGVRRSKEEIFVITKLYPNQFGNAAEAIEQAVVNGKICSIGLSNWYMEELEEFLPQINALDRGEKHDWYLNTFENLKDGVTH